MTEEQWLSRCVVIDMLGHLAAMVSDRKLRLLMCGCCRGLEIGLVRLLDESVEVAERFADGAATDDERKNAFESLCLSYQGTFRREADGSCHAGITRKRCLVAVALAMMTDRDVVTVAETDERLAGPEQGSLPSMVEIAARSCAAAAFVNTAHEKRLEESEVGFVKRFLKRLNYPTKHAIVDPWEARFVQWEWYHRSQLKASIILRDIFGNPFRTTAIDPAWLTSTVVALARGIYDERAFDRMPILADALEDAGCDNADILAHCRDAEATHVRGCWVIDLVLGKE